MIRLNVSIWIGRYELKLAVLKSWTVLCLRGSGKTPSPPSPCCVLFVAAAAGNPLCAPCRPNCTSLSHSSLTALICINVQSPTFPPVLLCFVLSLSCPSPSYLIMLGYVYFESLPKAYFHAAFLYSECLQFLRGEKRIHCGFRLFFFLWVNSFGEHAKTRTVFTASIFSCWAQSRFIVLCLLSLCLVYSVCLFAVALLRPVLLCCLVTFCLVPAGNLGLGFAAFAKALYAGYVSFW